MMNIRTALELLVIALREWRRLPLLGVAGWAFGCWCILAASAGSGCERHRESTSETS